MPTTAFRTSCKFQTSAMSYRCNKLTLDPLVCLHGWGSPRTSFVDQALLPGRVPIASDKRNALFVGCREPPRAHYLSTDIVSSNGAREVNTPPVCFLLHINFSSCVFTLLNGVFLVLPKWSVNRTEKWFVCLQLTYTTSSSDVKTHIYTSVFIYYDSSHWNTDTVFSQKTTVLMYLHQFAAWFVRTTIRHLYYET
jgi:hypothetical protein